MKRRSGEVGERFAREYLAEATFWILSKQEPYREPKASVVSSTGDKRGWPLSSRKLDR
jgi:hypothetical protein